MSKLLGLSALLLVILLSMGSASFALQSFTPTPSATPSLHPTATLLPTNQPSLTPSPTATPFAIATPRLVEVTPEGTPGTVDEAGVAIPSPIPTFDTDSTYEVFNFLLIGHDSESDGEQGGGYRTDSLILVSVNRTAGTVSMLSLPRDLYVYIPGWRSQRMNVVWDHGLATIGGNAGGFQVMRETLLYNFGIQVHYYAMIDFSGFKEIIDTLGGVDIAVDCPIQDYRFTGRYDTAGDPIFELITIDVGLHHMDSTTALMYARSRRTSNDFDRGRRQQQVLRAVFSAAKNGGFLSDIPTLYNQLNAIVETNIPFEVMLQLAPLGITLQPNTIESHFLHTGRESVAWTSPSGAAVQLPTDKLYELITAFLTPPTLNRLVAEGARIGIFDSSGLGLRWDAVAAERLVWEGLNPIPLGANMPPAGIDISQQSVIIDYTGQSKGSSVDILARILRIPAQDVYSVPDPDRTVDYAVYLSSTYNSCYDRQIILPNLPTSTPIP